MKIFLLPVRSSLQKAGVVALFLLLLGSWSTAEACVDPDTIATVIVNVDSSYTQIEVRVTNLRLMTESPNTFCSCAVSSWSSIFTNLLYVAFVDSGTNTPYGNFAQWEDNPGASGSWDATTSGYPSWNGYVAEVVNNGLSPNVPVDLLIRAALPPGYSFSLIDSSMYSTYIGTDEWDSANQTLTNSHQGLHWIPNQTFTISEVDTSYFTAMDLEIETAYNASSIDAYQLLKGLTFGPNPASDFLRLRFENSTNPITGIDIVDMKGGVFLPVFHHSSEGALHEVKLDLQQLKLPTGVYLLRIQTRDAQTGLKFVRR